MDSRSYPRFVDCYRHETLIEGVGNDDRLEDFVFFRLDQEIVAGIGGGSAGGVLLGWHTMKRK